MPDQEEKCEFTPCKTGPNTEPRKVISHIFGRNKALTKRFPACVWVHYCRQHYQRARYRARDWPVTQCQLVLVSLTRMEEWADSGIEGFRVVLRRRVTHPPPPPRNRPPATGGRAVGRRVTRSSTSSSSLPSSAAASTRKTRKSTIRQAKSSASEEQTSGFHPNKEGNKEGQKKQRKKPTIIPSPVPAWLRAEADATRVRSFAEVRDIVERLKEGFEQGRDSGSGALRSSAVDGGMDGTVRFPDIEILPVFRD